MTTKKELSDLAIDASLREHNAANESKQSESEKLPSTIRIGVRDADRGKHEVIYPNDSKTLNGDKIYSASNPDGAVVRATQPNKNLPVALDSRSAIKPPLKKIPEPKKESLISVGSGLLAVASGYAGDGVFGLHEYATEYARIMAALVAQLLGDYKGWDEPTEPVTDKKIFFYFDTYESGRSVPPLLAAALQKYGYKTDGGNAIGSQEIEEYSAFIARVVAFQETKPLGEHHNFIVGEPLTNLKTILENEGLVVLFGCGCPYAAQPLNELLSVLGANWTLPEDNPAFTDVMLPVGSVYGYLPDDFTEFPDGSAPYKIIKTQNFDSIEFTPYTTYRAGFSGVAPNEVLATSKEGVVMAYRKYPEVIT